MELKDVVQTVKEKADEAHNAYHAGHQDLANGYLGEARLVIEAYELSSALPGEDVSKAATSETSSEKTPETPAQVPGSPVQPDQAGPVLPASQFVKANPASKPPQ